MPTRRNATPPLLQGTLDMMILKVLDRGPEHGYGIVRQIRRRSGDVLVVEEGSLYPALHRLQKRRFVTSQWRTSESNRRARYYQLSERGRKQLREEGRAWQTMAHAIGRVMESLPGGASSSTAT